MLLKCQHIARYLYSIELKCQIKEILKIIYTWNCTFLANSRNVIRWWMHCYSACSVRSFSNSFSSVPVMSKDTHGHIHRVHLRLHVVGWRERVQTGGEFRELSLNIQDKVRTVTLCISSWCSTVIETSICTEIQTVSRTGKIINYVRCASLNCMDDCIWAN